MGVREPETGSDEQLERCRSMRADQRSPIWGRARPEIGRRDRTRWAGADPEPRPRRGALERRLLRRAGRADGAAGVRLMNTVVALPSALRPALSIAGRAGKRKQSQHEQQRIREPGDGHARWQLYLMMCPDWSGRPSSASKLLLLLLQHKCLCLYRSAERAAPPDDLRENSRHHG